MSFKAARRSVVMIAVGSLAVACGSGEQQAAPPAEDQRIEQRAPQNATAVESVCIRLLLDDYCPVDEATNNVRVWDRDNVNEPLAFVNLSGILSVAKASSDSPPVLSVIDLPAVRGLVDGQSDKILTTRQSTQSSGFALGTGTSGGGGSYACVNNKTNRDFVAFEPVTTSGSDNVQQWRWQFNSYAQYRARTVSGRSTWQFEVCANGGYDGQNGYRSFYNASVIAADTIDGNRRIGLTADTGSDGTATSSIDIAAAGGPITISGSIPTGGGGSHFGQYGKPKYPANGDRFFQTQSFAGWKSGCTYARTCGSPNAQNQVHNALFEFYSGDYNHQFPIDVQANVYCSGPYGKGCG